MPTKNLLDGLNDSQVEAVRNIEGPIIILAGPGSGKTRVITHRIAYMIEQGIAPSSILALTFTNKAAGEMRTRTEQLVGQANVWMGTFHGFCVRLLRRHARLAGLPENFSIYDSDDSQAALKVAVQEAKFELTHTSIGTLANRISYYKNRLVTPDILQAESLSSEEYSVSQVYPAYQSQLLKCGAVDFDDLLLHTAILLRSYPELRQQLDERFQYVMVDEYQDTNLAQYVIMRNLSVEYPNLAATGDPDQSIYGWRGANVRNLTNLERDYPGVKVLRLEQNYRSTPEILSVADCLIQHNEYRKPKVLVPSRNSGQPVTLAIYSTAREEAEDVAEQIAAMVSEGDSQFQDFGILYRTNAHSRLIERSLLRRQIPYQLIGGYRFYLRREIKDLIAYLLLVNNPQDDVAFQRVVNLPARGVGKQTIAKVRLLANQSHCSMLDAARIGVEQGTLSKRAATGIKSFLKIFDSLCTLVHGPLLDLLESAIEQTDYREHLRKTADAQDESELFFNLDELLAEAKDLDAEDNSEQPALERFLEFAALQGDTDRLKSDANLVTLMTLHAAKGLEFPNVFLMACEENILPHVRSKDDPMQLEEERRLLFVGITRAMDRLQLSYAKSRGFASQGSGVPSSFLVELPRGEMQILDRSDRFDEEYDRGAGFDEYFESPNHDWDEMNQSVEMDEGLVVEFDDMCQLPPDEMRKRIGKQIKRGRGPQLMLGSEMPDLTRSDDGNSDSWSKFEDGCIVLHQKFGSGEIISSSGHGPKRAVTINFFADGSRRTFRLSHVSLKIESSSS